MGAVYAGWLTKSPEDRKGLFSLFAARQQWRRRFFVLYSAPISSDEEKKNGRSKQTMTSSPVLVYYKDEAMTSKKGIIDLDHCEEIVDHVESCYYQHLFLLKTVNPNHRSRQRTYYLATDSSDEVTSWVTKLRSTLNLCEDELFRHAVLSITNSGSDVTGIIATVSESEENNDGSNSEKSSVAESLTPVNHERQLSHIHWLIVNSEQPNNTGLCDNGHQVSRISVSKCGETKVLNQKIDPPFESNVSAEATSSTESIEVMDVNSTAAAAAAASNPSSVTPPHHKSNDDRLQSEKLPGNACNGEQQQHQTGAEYCEDWPKFVKDLLDDGDEHQGTEKVEEEGQKGGKVEGKSVFYVCNMSSFSPDTTASPNDEQKGHRSTSSESNAEEDLSSFPSTLPSSGVTCYLRITKGSHRYKSVKRRQQNIATVF